MPSIRFLFFLILLALTGSQGFLAKKTNVEDVATTGEKFQHVKTIAQNVKDVISLKKKSVVDAVTAVGNAKHNIIHDIKDTKKKLVESVLASHIAKVNAIKAAKEEYVKTIMAQKQPFYFVQKKLQKIKEAVPALPPVEGLKNRFLNFFLEFVDKFQGHFKQHKKVHNDLKDTLTFAFIPHPISNGLPQVQGVAANTEEHKPEINYFPSAALPSEAQTTDVPSFEYVQQPVHVQPDFESVQTADILSGFQSNQFSPSSEYDESTQDDFTPPEYLAVDFTNHQSIPYVPSSSYYGSPPASVNSPSATYAYYWKMQTIILLSLIVLGANAGFWRRHEYPNQQWSFPQGRSHYWGNDKTLHYHHGFPQWYLQQGHSQLNIDIDKSLAEAEWICRSPKTADILIVASHTEDQSQRPIAESMPNFKQEQNQDTPSQHYTQFPSIQTTTENAKPSEMSTHGGEGIIDVRIGEA
ncbi:hypothetical protein KPH14_010179 [Odynerus spinipes]|uniref:Uncharacterized protein n=1 Tax=Odynerus spinipes TaxID=1348599 RepID=A0AAD9RT98_9HYME|nr:hypothetical protein KPH14_010179 [Odynerus spinipes]